MAFSRVHDGSVHEMVTPARIGPYMRIVDLENQAKLVQLRDETTQLNASSASDVKSAVYEYGNSAAGSTGQIMMFIGSHLAHAAPATSITDFTQKFTGATSVSAGSLASAMRMVRPDLEIVVKN